MFAAQNAARARSMIATSAHTTFAGARLVESINRTHHRAFIERRIAVKRYIDAPERPRHIVGDVACREFAETFPCPPQSCLGEEQPWVDWSLVMWAKSTKTHPTDRNPLCESRYNRYIFCSGKIPPASQTAAVWQMNTPRVPDLLPPPTLLELIHREKRLIREQRERRLLLSKIVSGYEADWRTQAEREELLRDEPFCWGSTDHAFYFQTEKLSQPSNDLLHEWNRKLLEHSQSEKTPLKEELDFYPPSSRENTADGRERSPDDEKVTGFEFDGINHEGVRETGSWQGTEQVTPVPEPHREVWLVPRRTYFNPLKKKLNEATEDDKSDVTEDPDFIRACKEYEIEFGGQRVTEAAQELGLSANTLSQQISRQEYMSLYPGIDIAGSQGKFFCVVTLGGKSYLKILGEADAPMAEVWKAFIDAWCASESNAIKQARKSAMKTGADQQTREAMVREAVRDIRDAYDVVISVPDEGFYGLEDFIAAVAKCKYL
jgi:hypothetical protein